MQARKNFKTLAPKDIIAVLAKVGVLPAVTPETLDNPNCDHAITFFQHLAEFAYDMEINTVKNSIQDSQVEGFPRIDHPEIYEDAIDVLTVFGLSRQLMTINGIEDFCLKDMWDPQAKKMRASLSAMINFCRYRTGKMQVIAEMKQRQDEQHQIMIDMVEQGNVIDAKLQAAKVRHSEEVQQAWVAENEIQAAQVTVERLHKTRQQVDCALEDAEARLAERTRQAAEQAQRAASLKEQVTSLQEQIAESPEGLEREIREMQLKISEQKARVQVTSDNKRVRAQRVQTLSRLLVQIEAYGTEIDRLSEVVASEGAAKTRARSARDELGKLQQALDARQAEDAELEKGVRQATVEIEDLKEEHERRMQELEARRQQSLSQHQELQAKRTEDQSRTRAMQTQRMELEAEIARVRHGHALDVAELRAQMSATAEQDEQYISGVESLISDGGSRPPAASPAPGRKHGGGASPFPSASPDVTDKRRRASAALFRGAA